ncbi:hypothetical protein RVR_4019 [Actinacidiphila reveromycinica]|uniref:Uncharacterized protein n=1 Tax=Actinacidiphila reveromycinica TaxID=659352 RepID=A0A7U3USP8_9ACTN|nr:hypothetical protein [Streptomyces sp. SN-593]BBA98003.1 hypothetical protein RVR_4019 [Streptomyces sp. SN-593]
MTIRTRAGEAGGRHQAGAARTAYDVDETFDGHARRVDRDVWEDVEADTR